MDMKWARLTTRAAVVSCLAMMSLILGSGCSWDDMLGTDTLPPDVLDPAITETPQGALAAYQGTVAHFRNAFGGYRGVVEYSGVLTDELEQGGANLGAVDYRQIREGSNQGLPVYSKLHRVRGQAAQAIGLLTRFAPGSEDLVGHLYALQAYSEIFLAELFCSGIPLSTLDYDGNYTYKPGSTTEQVYEHAFALLDTAASLSMDSVWLTHLVSLGKARIHLALGRYLEAAGEVSGVPDDYSYEVRYSSQAARIKGAFDDPQHFATIESYRTFPGSWSWTFSVSDREGGNGLDFISSGDPRVQVTSNWGNHGRDRTIYHPSKYPVNGSGSIVLASGIEARLVEAEAALHAGNTGLWLEKLNHLRRTAWTTIRPAAAGPLPDLTDPGHDEARIDLLFRERAFWLFLTGQRQGDLRRLVRNYGRSQDKVYPIGLYMGSLGETTPYGSDIDLPVPLQESVVNPHYTGCMRRGA